MRSANTKREMTPWMIPQSQQNGSTNLNLFWGRFLPISTSPQHASYLQGCVDFHVEKIGEPPRQDHLQAFFYRKVLWTVQPQPRTRHHPFPPKDALSKTIGETLGNHQFSQIIIRENWTQNVGIAYILEKWKCANSPASNEAENEWEHYLDRFSRLRCGRNLTYL